MNELLTKENFNNCGICAYHEAGHILFAYLCGYSCVEVQLIEESNEEGYSSYAMIDYGKDASLASKFTTSSTDIEHFKVLSLGEKLESIEVGRRLARIFLGGSVAAAVFNNEGSVYIPLPMQVDLTDLMHVDYIDSVIKEISPDKEEDLFIENGLQDALYTLANVNIWDTIVDLANRLLQRKQLDKGDIEECLEEHGIIYREGTTEVVTSY